MDQLIVGLNIAADLPSPRVMKSHLPVWYKYIDKQSAKIIVVMRNVKDCLVSYQPSFASQGKYF